MRRALLLLALTACGGGDDEPLACNLGDLTGTWRVTYAQKDGNCGPLPAETVSLASPSAAGCVEHSSSISSDRCRVEADETCPTGDGRGSQRWTVVLTQVEAARLTGSATVQGQHSTLGSCRSTYDITASRL